MEADDSTPLLRSFPSLIPPATTQPGIEKLDMPATLPRETIIPAPNFTQVGTDRKRPQCISHRGYKAKFPENTILAFDEAIKVGTHALETDVHLTKDGVVVLCHDASLKRCFGRNARVTDLNWDEIKDLRTLAKPHVPMPRLADLLAYLAKPGLEEIWLLLDIKLDNDSEAIMRRMAATIAEAPPALEKAWKHRIVLGIWAAKYLPLAVQYFPEFPAVHIGVSISYARHFFRVPEIGFNILMPMLAAPGGNRFIQDCQTKYHRRLLAWTVNARDRMEWCIRRGLDGVITDNPRLFLEVCDQFDHGVKEPLPAMRIQSYFYIYRLWISITVMFWMFRRAFSPVASPDLIRRTTR